MKLTGKCQEDFKKWISNEFEPNEHGIIVNASYEGDIEVYASDNFDILPKSMQYGVYVDFFDSVGIRISMNQFNNEYWFDIDPQGIDSECLKTRPEARAAAIEKANEIKNK